MPPREPTRILRIIARLNVGGPALHVSYLTRRLDEIGYETTLCAGRVGPGEGSMEYVADELGVAPVFVPELQREISPFIDAAAVRRLVQLIRETRPHILHTHTAKAGAVGRMAALLAGPSKPPVVLHTFHGHVLRSYFGATQTHAFRALEAGLARVSDALIAVSPEVRDDLVGLGVAPADKIAVIRLGLDLGRRLEGSLVARAELALPDDAFVVGWFGRMTEIKRVDLLLESFARLRRDVPEAVLLLAGDGPLRERLETQARELGLDGSCRFLGFRQDVGPLYGAIDALALTSANEGTPVVAIEALAARVPVVATDVGGVRDVVAPGRSGFLVPSGDSRAITDRLAELARDRELRRRLGEAGRLHVLPRYSVDRLVADVDTLYGALLDERAARRHRDGRQVSQRLPRALPPVRTRTARPLRVLLVSQYFPPEVGATQSRVQSFAEHLSDRGHDVTVISEFPNHPRGVIPPQYAGRLIEDDRSNAYRILRTWVKTNPEKTQVTRLEFYLSYMAMAALAAPRAGRPDVVLATTPPLFTAAAGLAIARAWRAPFVLDVRDLWPAAATSLNQISGGLVTRGAELLERQLYRSADAVVAVTKPFCEHIDRLRGKPPATALIPNGTLDLFFGAADGAGPANGGFTVTFAGTLGIAQALPSVLDAAAELADGFVVQLVGDGPMRDQLVADAEGRGLANVRFRPQMPLESIPPVLATSDALLVSLAAHPTFRSFIPSKMVDFMATGRPVILAAAGEAARLAEGSRAAVVVPPEDPRALADAIRWVRDHPAEAREMGRRGREFARTRLRSVQAERLEQVLVDTVERASTRRRPRG
ncbi:MAG TPA: glycosyltransferase [Gaiellaceae bacterium]|nr:glycosyltransferase [Gaiellaceae bacterium]